ncbi:MAG: hypothetical protein G01um101449_97 [Parcubacteria group bacterium Gr01-1014_49]|nr:MAG: hypothetical protein G01um101449_97 [Parcubacteria group bacterium Gr01-1014_49]
MKKVAAVLKYSSEEGLYTHKEKRIRLAQLTRQTKNRRNVIFSNILSITLLVPAWLHLR